MIYLFKWLICIGKKSRDYFKSRDYRIILEYFDFWNELNFNQSILSNHLNSGIYANAKLISLKLLDNNNSFTVNEWEELYKLSEDTFVEETDSLKQTGAGAGLTDNDWRI